MSLTEVRPTGRAYLELVTRLLQRVRLRAPVDGLWEAADLQWWWRIDQHTDETGQVFWLDGDDPVVATVFSPWGSTRGVDILGTPADLAIHADLVWGVVDRNADERVLETLLSEDDPVQIDRAKRNGFVAQEGGFETCWLAADARPRVPAPATGYELVDYGGGPHPMARRNGDAIAERLAECSLYRRDLDLAVRAADGTVAGYALFWADPVTGVGLVEPMRVEDEHAGRGLGGLLLAAGLDRLAAAGCIRLKVTHDPANQAAHRLYLGSGFRPVTKSRSWRRA